MNILIVHAHPEPKSFNGAMTRVAHSTLADQNHTVEVSDLYAMNFDPVSSRENFETVADPDFLKLQTEEMYAAQNNGFRRVLAKEQSKLESADLVIFQFPLWWFGFPAIMKGWVDRVFAMGRIYSRGGIYAGASKLNRQALLSFTTGAPAQLFTETGAYGPIDQILLPIRRGILEYVGFEVLPNQVVHQPARLSQDGRQAELTRWEKRLRDYSH
ncbi:MAG: NAD(P)H-dependent oxidoreductase [Pseudomonadota bacterium]